MNVAAVIGCGMVGASTAMRIGEAALCERLALVDVDEGLAQAMALDVGQALPAAGSDTRCAAGWDAVDGAGLVVVTAGRPRAPGQSRADLLEGNARIVADVCGELRRRAPDAVVIIVTNPLDEMTALAQRVLGFPAARVIGMAGQLDTLRFRAAIAARLDVPPSTVEALTLGSHGETMVPLPRLARVGGVPLAELLDAAEIDALVERTRDGGAEIVRLLKRGSAWWAPSAAILAMARAIVRDERSVWPVSAMCRGQFGIRNVYVGVPARLGAGGVVEIVDPGLTAAEVTLLRAAADEVAARVADLDAFAGAAEPAPAADAPPPVAGPVGGVADLRLASQIRTAARAALARQGRLDRLDEVVAAALRRAGR
jgi:malate dehydrogenase